jgi:hypothetical protein
VARSYDPLLEAGPLRLPAAIVHPDDELPSTWRLFSTWSYRGQRGAWLLRHNAGEPLREHRRAPGRESYEVRLGDAALIVYRAAAPRRNRAHVGTAISKAAQLGHCANSPEPPIADQLRSAPAPSFAEREAHRKDERRDADQQFRQALVKAFNRQPDIAALEPERYAAELERAERHARKRRAMTLPDGFAYDLRLNLAVLARENGWRVPEAWKRDWEEDEPR